MKKETTWWKTHLGVEPAQLIQAQVEGVERILNFEPRSRVLHLGCGSGRQTLQLAMRGHRVLGLDWNDEALTEARQAARAERLNVHFLKSDFLEIPYSGEFDAVICLSGAFGRLPEDSDDGRIVDTVRKSLKPGGHCLLDLLNKEWLMRHFEPNAWDQSADGHGEVVLNRASFNFETGRLDTHRMLVGNNGARQAVFVSERVYTLTEIKKTLSAGGLVYRQSWGEYDGAPYGMDTRRLIVLAQKPEHEAPRKPSGPNLVSALRIKGRGKSRK